MAMKDARTEIRLKNGDVLISPSTNRDPEVDAAFKSAVDAFRQRQQERMAKLRSARQTTV
jgi:hypothetical protein